PVDPRRVHGHRIERRRAHHRAPAALAALGARTVPAPLAAMRMIAWLRACFSPPACGRGRGWVSPSRVHRPSPSPSRKREGNWLLVFAALALASCHVAKSDTAPAEPQTYGAG